MAKPKVILFDCDGVLIRYPNSFLEELERQGYANARSILGPFLQQDQKTLDRREKEDEMSAVLPYLREMGWAGTAEEFFAGLLPRMQKHLDRNLIAEIQKIRQQGVRCCLATNQWPYQKKQLLEDLGLKDSFDRHYISCDIGFKKAAPGFWQYVLRDLEKELGAVNPWDIVYFDDSHDNVETASRFGLQSYFFKDLVQFERDLNMLGLYVTLNKYC
jgi:HAD superfamily hydrolase (TIGR01509 family)